MDRMRLGRISGLTALLAGICLPLTTTRPAVAAPAWEETRLKRMKFDQIVRALEARQGQRIADLGAGGGTFTAALSRVVAQTGTVYAVEIEKAALERLKKRKREEALTNVEIIHAAEDDPKLPAESLDGVLLVDTYH